MKYNDSEILSFDLIAQRFEIETLLTLLEENGISNESIMDLISNITNVDVELSSHFFTKKIREGIDSKKLLNVMRHFQEYEKVFLPFNIKLNQVIIWQFINGEHPEYLYDLLERDPLISKSLFTELGRYLVTEVTSEQAEKYIQDIAKNTRIDLCELYYVVLKSASNFTKRIMILDYIDDVTSYDILVKLYSDVMTVDAHKLATAIIYKLDIKSSKLYDIIKSRLHDDYGICLAIRNVTDSTHILSNNVFRMLLFDNARYIPKTIKYLFESAINADKLNFLIDFAEIYDKREILKVLLAKTEENNKNIFYLNVFIKMYKESKEIRNLMPFI